MTADVVMVMDIHMLNVDGIKATAQMKEDHPAVNVILLTTTAEEELY